jgi:hypothetical protein
MRPAATYHYPHKRGCPTVMHPWVTAAALHNSTASNNHRRLSDGMMAACKMLLTEAAWLFDSTSSAHTPTVLGMMRPEGPAPSSTLLVCKCCRALHLTTNHYPHKRGCPTALHLWVTAAALHNSTASNNHRRLSDGMMAARKMLLTQAAWLFDSTSSAHTPTVLGMMQPEGSTPSPTLLVCKCCRALHVNHACDYLRRINDPHKRKCPTALHPWVDATALTPTAAASDPPPPAARPGVNLFKHHHSKKQP